MGVPRHMKKVLLGVLAVLVLVVGGVAIFAMTVKPKSRPAPDIQVERTPERIERGRYLANNVLLCTHCHSEIEYTRYGTPVKEGKLGVGGDCFTKENAGFPGKVCAQNLTPDKETGIGAWTDGEIMRAVREGISRDGHALFPMMPYKMLRSLSDEDTMSLVAYLRTIPPVRKVREEGHVDFPVSLFIKFEPQPLDGPVQAPDRKDTLAYGKYLSFACLECHSPVDDKMQRIEGKSFAGGREFKFGPLRVRSSNLTFDPTGQGSRTREEFIGMFAAWRGIELPVLDPKDNTMMPWAAFSGMTDEDLSAIYDHLKSMPQVSNVVERRIPPEMVRPAAETEQEKDAG
jgi:hypothetical protein